MKRSAEAVTHPAIDAEQAGGRKQTLPLKTE